MSVTLPPVVPTVSPVPIPTLSHLPIPTDVRVVEIGKLGSDAQWAAVVIFVLATIAFAVHSTFVHRKARTFHLVTTLLCAVTALSYYAAATGSGRTFIRSGIIHRHPIGTGHQDILIIRQIFYARFIEWFFTTPLILLNLALLSGLAWIDVFTLLVLDELMIVCAMMGGVTRTSRAMWGWYGFMLLFFFYVFYILLVRARHAASKQPAYIKSLYDLIFALTFVFIFPYVIVFALGDGSGHISVDAQAAVFVVLDIAIRIVIPYALIHGYHSKVEDAGYGPNSIPDHLYEHREHGWEGGVQLPEDN